MAERNRDESNHEPNERDEPRMNPYRVMVSGRFVLVSMFASVLLAFAVGRAAHFILLEGPRQAMLTAYQESRQRDRPIGGTQYHGPPLPFLVAKDGEKIPHTRYTSKTFDTAKSTMSSSWLITNRDAHMLEGEDDVFPQANHDASETCKGTVPEADDESTAENVGAIADIRDEREISQPAGEHLMVDMKNVDGAFLNSEHRLARAMIDVIDAANLTLLSYHCHVMEPSGVSCVGILMHNYIAFHTWPDEGVVTFDLVAGEGESILPVLPVIEERFGVPRAASYNGEAISLPSVRWAHRLRGFRHDPTKISDLFQTTDLGVSFLSILGTEFKEEVPYLL